MDFSNLGPHDQELGALTTWPPGRFYFPSFGFVCVEILRPSQPNGIMLSVVSLPNHTFTGQA